MEQDKEVKLVQLDGLVVLKIAKHCRENLPEDVTGLLLGLDVGSTVEVTNSFPFPKVVSEETEEETPETESNSGAEFQISLLTCLRDVNADAFTIGWYTSAYMFTFQNEDTIETQYSYQERLKNSITLVYDPIKTAQGYLSLRAYRLTKEFMELRKTQQYTKESLAKAHVSFNTIFEEIPIKIKNSAIVNAFLSELQETRKTDTDFDRLDLISNPYLERNLDMLGECLDELAQEHNKFQYFQRNLSRQQVQKNAWLQKRRAENAQRRANGEEPLPEDDPNLFKPLQEPKRLDALLLTNQINSYCEEINQYAGNSFAKLFIATNLHTSNPQ